MIICLFLHDRIKKWVIVFLRQGPRQAAIMYRSWENRIPARRHARSQIIPLWCVTTDNVTEVNFRLAEALIAGQLFLSYPRPCRTLWSVCKNSRCHCFRKSCFERWMYLYVSRWPTCTGVIGIGQSLQRTTYQKMTRSQNLLVISFSSVSGQRGCKFQQASIWIKTELNWCLVSFAWWGVQRNETSWLSLPLPIAWDVQLTINCASCSCFARAN